MLTYSFMLFAFCSSIVETSITLSPKSFSTDCPFSFRGTIFFSDCDLFVVPYSFVNTVFSCMISNLKIVHFLNVLFWCFESSDASS